MSSVNIFSPQTLPRDFIAGIVTFLVALPLCLGIAAASGAPAFSGVVAGIIGGLVVAIISGSHSSVSGPAAGLTAVVAAQIIALGNFQAFCVAVIIAGVIQLVLGIARAGFLAAFFPSSVIKGLLAAIGLLLILKELPHLLGHDKSPEGDMAFLPAAPEMAEQHGNTFSELWHMFSDMHYSAMFVGFTAVALLVVWDKVSWIKKSGIPGPLVAVVYGVLGTVFLARYYPNWEITASHLVKVPVANTFNEFLGFFTVPKINDEFRQLLANPALYTAAFTIAIVASLETLLNLEAVDKIDPLQRVSPPSRELVAQGVGNMCSGFLGGLPVTSVIVRSSVNINAGGRTKLAAIVHGALLLLCIYMIPQLLNMIPRSALAAILVVTGFKLASPKLFVRMWKEGLVQFFPFAITISAILFSDLLKGVIIGLAVSVSFILYSNFRRPIRRYVEKHISGDVLRIDLPEQVSFFKRASLQKVLDDVPSGGHVLIDANNSDYIDPDVLDLIRDFKEKSGPARNVQLSLCGFRSKYDLDDHIHYVDYSSRDLQATVAPMQVLEYLRQGNARFRAGERLNRNLNRQVNATSAAQHPLAVVLSCIDSRAPVELILDVGVGDIFTVRVAGNVTSPKVLGSIEYACSVAGAKLIVVLGHTRCGAVTTAVKLAGSTQPSASLTGCQNVEPILLDIQESVDMAAWRMAEKTGDDAQQAYIDEVARQNVLLMVDRVATESSTLAAMVSNQKVAVVGAMYDVVTGEVTFFDDVDASRGCINLAEITKSKLAREAAASS